MRINRELEIGIAIGVLSKLILEKQIEIAQLESLIEKDEAALRAEIVKEASDGKT